MIRKAINKIKNMGITKWLVYVRDELENQK